MSKSKEMTWRQVENKICKMCGSIKNIRVLKSMFGRELLCNECYKIRFNFLKRLGK